MLGGAWGVGVPKMAELQRFLCSDCGRKVDVWSDGNPFYIDDTGNKKYAYHPDHEALAKCIGNDLPHLCLNCGHDVVVDSRSSKRICPDCGSDKVTEAFLLENVVCPTCRKGKFHLDDPSFQAIS